MNLVITKSAVSRATTLLAESPEYSALRVYVEGGGCGGMQYGFSFEAGENEDDFKIVQDGTTFLVDPISAQYLEGAAIDFVENIMGASFQIDNPNANTTCGCGSSFSPRKS